MIHTDPEYNMLITGAMKLAHFSQSKGLYIQMYTLAQRKELLYANENAVKIIELQ